MDLLNLIVSEHIKAKKKAVNCLVDQGVIRYGPFRVHDQVGWYTAWNDAELFSAGYPVSIQNREFPVPVECPWWHAAESDSRDQLVFRFFASRAWIDIKNEKGILEITIPYFINKSAMESLSIEINNKKVTPVVKYDLYNRAVLCIDCSSYRKKVLTVLFKSATAAQVCELFPSSTDTRYLSVAIAKPNWVME